MKNQRPLYTGLRNTARTIYVEQHMVYGLSDMCEDTLMIEWDGIHGKFRQTFKTLEKMDAALDKADADAEAKIEEIYQELITKRKNEMATREETKNSIGNLFPELAEIFKPHFM